MLLILYNTLVIEIVLISLFGSENIILKFPTTHSPQKNLNLLLPLLQIPTHLLAGWPFGKIIGKPEQEIYSNEKKKTTKTLTKK